MTKRLILFGAGKIAEVMLYYFTHDSEFEVVAITCDREHITEKCFHDIPVVSFDEVDTTYPPSDCDMFVALGYQDLNALRATRVRQAKAKGYRLASHVHPAANIPQHTKIGDNCFIMANVCIQPYVQLGSNVFVWSGALIGHHSIIGDNCWITSNANISGQVQLGNNCFVAVNATIGNDVSVGDNCFLGANTLVTKDLSEGQVVIESATEIFRLNSRQFLKLSSFH